ncbi:MAG: hypothetical protein FJX62_21300, partial [Alphaproteobacteria bacterium]|nr:hypothetical protein [Alphaproteobacteria bacterium]
MADDNNARYRPNDSYGREPGNAGQGNDPLAELARLIGKSDPFAELDRAAQEHNAARQYAEPQHPHYAGEPQQGYAQPQSYAPAPGYPGAPPLPPLPNFGSDPLFGEPLPPRQNEYPPRYAENPPPPQPEWPSAPPPFAHDPFALPSAASAQHPHAPHPAEPRFDPQGFGAHQPAGGGYQPDLPGFVSPPYQPASDRPPFAPPVYPSEPNAGAMPPPHDDEFYDDAPRNDRRKGMVTVLAVLGLAVLGTAAAFGYRSLFGGPGGSSPPPIIRASNEPAKVAPPKTAAADPAASKINYDRFGDRSQNEQVVVREEKPVDTSDLARTAAPRAVVPTLTSPPQAAAGGNPPGTIGEPRRVRTVPIRPDGPESAAPSQAAAPPPMPVSPPRQTTTATAASNAPLDVTPSGSAVRQPAQP